MNSIHGQLLFYANALWRRRWNALAVAWIMCLVGWAVVATIPDTYRASARIYVDTASLLSPLLSGIAVETDLEAEVQMMQKTLLSKPNLRKVAEMAGIDATAKTPAAMQALLTGLSKRIQVTAEEKNLYSVSFADTDPQLAKDVVHALVAIFVEGNLGASRTDMDRARRFIDEQIRSYEVLLEQAEQRLATFKQQNLQLLPGAAGYHGRLETAERELALAEAELKDAMKEREVLQRELASIPRTIQFWAGPALGPPTDKAVRMMELQGQLDGLLTKYTERHPDVIRVQRKLEELRGETNSHPQGPPGAGGPLAAEADRDSGFGVPNPVHGEVQLKLIEQESSIETLKERVARGQDKMAELLALATQVPAVEAQLTKLNRDYSVLKAKFEELLARREQAKISDEREERARTVQFRIVEPAQVPPFPSGPNRYLFLTAALIAGLGTGIGLAWVLVLLDETFSNARVLRDEFGLPVLGTVSDVDSLGWRSRPLVQFSAVFLVLLALFTAFGSLVLAEWQFGLHNLTKAEMGIFDGTIENGSTPFKADASSVFDPA